MTNEKKKLFRFDLRVTRSGMTYEAEHCGEAMAISPGRSKHFNDNPENLTCLICGKRYKMNYHQFSIPKITQEIEVEENGFATKAQIETLKRRMKNAGDGGDTDDA